MIYQTDKHGTLIIFRTCSTSFFFFFFFSFQFFKKIFFCCTAYLCFKLSNSLSALESCSTRWWTNTESRCPWEKPLQVLRDQIAVGTQVKWARQCLVQFRQNLTYYSFSGFVCFFVFCLHFFCRVQIRKEVQITKNGIIF